MLKGFHNLEGDLQMGTLLSPKLLTHQIGRF